MCGMGWIDFSIWHGVVAGTSLAAIVVLAGSRRLRLHSAAIVASGCVWAAAFLFVLPALSVRGGGEQDLGSAVGDAVLADCCGLGLGGYHLLLCAALGLQAFRFVSRKNRGGREIRSASEFREMNSPR
jgi:hypothetical protein